VNNVIGSARFDQLLTASNMHLITPFLEDPDVFEVRINKFGQVVCDTISGRRFHEVEGLTQGYLDNLLSFLLNQNGLDKQAINNVIFPDGSRGIFCVPPAVIDGTMLVAIRKHMETSKSLDELASEGRFSGFEKRTITREVFLEPFEKQLVEHLDSGDLVKFFRLAVHSRRNIAVAGSTGSGKTTFMRSLMDEIPGEERILMLEDVNEIKAKHQQEIGFMLYGDQEGRLSAQEALKACKRLTPDRVMMTELRDDAAWDYLCLSYSGHPGSIFSTHADSALATPIRIAQLVKQSKVGAALDWDVIMRTITSAIDVIVYMEKRQIKEILYDPLGKKRTLAEEVA